MNRLFQFLLLAVLAQIMSSCGCECKSSRPLGYYYAEFDFRNRYPDSDSSYYVKLKGQSQKYPLHGSSSWKGVKLPINLNQSTSTYILKRGGKTDTIGIAFTKKYGYVDHCGMELEMENVHIVSTTLPTDSIHFSNYEGICVFSIR